MHYFPGVDIKNLGEDDLTRLAGWAFGMENRDINAIMMGTAKGTYGVK